MIYCDNLDCSAAALPGSNFCQSHRSAAKVIGTHSGSFHCDECLAVHMLKQLPDYKNAKVIRSRDPKVLDTCDILVDVGATYEPEKHRYDHHQRGFTETFSEDYPTKLSSAGLIYKHFGKAVIREIAVGLSEEDNELLFQKIYKSFIQALDAIDNGISQYPEDVKPAYTMNTDLSSRVGKLNPRWNEDEKDIDERFQKAVNMAGQEFNDAVDYLAKAWLPARDIVKQSLAKRFETHSSGEIVVISPFTNWKDHLLQLEQEQTTQPNIKYVLYEDTAKAWRIQAVPVSSSSFQSRLPLPEAWRGIRDDALSEIAAVPGCIFIHASGFIGGAKTFDGVLSLATKALEQGGDSQDAKKQKMSA